MSEGLDRSARDVIEAGREAALPNEFVAERIRRAVERTLAGSTRPARSRIRTVPVLVALGAAALAGALYATELVRTRESPPLVPKPAPVLRTPRARLESPPAVAAEPSNAATVVAPVPPPEPARIPPGDRASAAPSSRTQRLAGEIELLARVNASVNAGNGKRALELLAEYDREFRPAILAEERGAATVLALCVAGRSAEARAAAKRFNDKWQRSPHSARISKSCAGTE